MAAVSSMIALSVAAAASMLAAKKQADGMEAQGEFAERQGKVNARLAEMQSDDALARGDAASKQAADRANQVRGAQRVGFAAQGVALDSGSAQDVQQETARLGALDALTVKNNAQREAWGYRIQANQYLASGEQAVMAGRNSAGATLLTGGAQAVGQIASYQPRGAGASTRNVSNIA